MQSYDLYEVYEVAGDVLFPVLVPPQKSNAAILTISLITGKIVEVPKKTELIHLTIDIMAACAWGFEKVVAAVQVLQQNTIAITGLARSGKDTLCDMMLKHLDGYVKVSLGDALRDVREIVYGKSAKKDRHELILIGQGLRKDDPLVWVKAWIRRALQLIMDGAQGIILTDVRQPNEFAYFKAFAKLIFIQANEKTRLQVLAEIDGFAALNPALLKNETELYISSFMERCDYTITNYYDGKLEDSVIQLLDEMGLSAC